MRLFKFIFAGVCLLFAAATVCYGADVAQIAIFDFGRILDMSDAGKAAQEMLNKRGGAMADDLKRKSAELEELKKNIERETLVMPEDKRAEKEREFRIKVNDLKEIQRQYSQDMREIQEKLKTEIEKDVREIISEIGKTRGYLMILEKNRGGVYYYPNSLDITDDIIRRYNEVYARKLTIKTD